MAVLALTLALGLFAGVAMGALAAARRGSTTVDRLLAAYHLPTNSIYSFAEDPEAQLDEVTRLLDDNGIERRRLFSAATLLTFPGQGDGFATQGAGMLAEIDIEPGPESKAVLVAGRRPVAADELAVTQGVLKNLGVHVGDRVEMAWYHYADLETLGGGGTATPKGTRQMLITGEVLSPQQLLRDARAEEGTIFESNANIGLLSPAFWNDVGPDIATYGVGAGVDVTPEQSAQLLERSGTGTIAVERGVGGDISALGSVRSAIDIESAALIAFGVILAAAGAGFLGMAIGRVLNVDAEDRVALDAIGVATRDRLRTAAGLGAIVGAVAGIVAVTVALVLSTRAPFGYASEAEISSGLDVDRPVLVLGAALVVLVSVVAAAVGARAKRVARVVSVSTAGWHLGRPLPATVGLRLLGQTARGRGGAAVRIAGVIAVAGTVAAVAAWAFAGSMRHLDDSPRLQGWNWDLAAGNYSEPESAQAGARALAASPDVEAFVGYNEQSVFLDGMFVAVAGFDGDAITPRVLSGRAPAADDEIALGADTLRRLGKSVGETVDMSIDERKRETLTIVGVITPPAGLTDAMALDSGGTTTLQALQNVVSTEEDSEILQVYVYFVRLKPGVDLYAARDRLQTDFPGTVNTARPTADVRSLQRVEVIPYLLATMIGVAGLVAVVIVLAGLARRRRRDLALLRCAGFTGRQLVGVVLWQATAFAAAALAIGIPLGVVAGRWLWRVAADRIGTDIGPAVPVGSIALAMVGLVVLANGLALLPAAHARRTRPATALRAD